MTGKHDKKATEQACAESISEALLNAFPEVVTIDFDSQANDTKSIIDESNEKAKSAIIKAYAENETERVRRQKYLLWAVVALTAIQMIFFNVVIAFVACQSFKSNQPDVLNKMFEILKYYIGATVVELIGMVVYITSGTFSTSHVDTMKMLFTGTKK